MVRSVYWIVNDQYFIGGRFHRIDPLVVLVNNYSRCALIVKLKTYYKYSLKDLVEYGWIAYRIMIVDLWVMIDLCGPLFLTRHLYGLVKYT